MHPALLALLPVFVVILLGWGLRRIHFPGDGAWPALERLTYFVLFPALLITTLAGADFSAVPVWRLLGGQLAAVLLVGLAVVAGAPRLGVDGPALSSLFQGTVRFNTYVFLPTVASLLGPDGLAVGAVSVCMVPVINVLCVAVLVRHGAGAGDRSVADQFLAVATNPLILACVAGIGLNLAGVTLPAALTGVLEILARAALPLGLLAVGAGLSLAGTRAAGVRVATALVLKLVAMPAVGLAALHVLEVDGSARAVGVLWCAMPTASSAYILARQLGGDAPLMASIITVSHLAAMLTLPVVAAVMI